ncbi:hypothetical protein ACFFF5_11605 [Lederbergia wuyishanensis]|uniref:Uncharacterized protein n=1 Tax=Lederbergia wuyishanensis TaxID=1347903 RepID=A0ABU0D3Z4_9BACI|nr:hypothetical protein [Lederbergia wuyishanensis]MCJ8008275.1 hypothetical protein [Lederbergia wuyishanensis]MDQ0343134.1 hypothetical protein [Lederbergia wuyishanensis]
MNKIICSLFLILSLFYLSGCKSSESKEITIGNPTAEEVLRQDEKADIFQWDDLIYTTNVDWVNELELTRNELIGEIQKSFIDFSTTPFENGMANKLPIGAKIYSAKQRGGILIVEFNNEEKYYLALVEG